LKEPFYFLKGCGFQCGTIDDCDCSMIIYFVVISIFLIETKMMIFAQG